ncbi:unnamed protein product [Nezara viridula]|uniref:Uncharacterized protein n=1 Tax=Nezara viridula TaxID=85310 RepID=A0A9P0MUT9_NEZVI|nr:unnamed protein product [Nezara viridula]
MQTNLLQKCCNIAENWFCHTCVKSVSKNHATTAAELSEGSNTSLLAEVKKIAEDIKEVKISLGKQSDLAFENNERLRKIEELALKQEKIIENLVSENKTLKSQIIILEYKLNQAEQAQLANNVEIRGITVNPDKTTEGLVCSIGAALGVKLYVEDLNFEERKRSRREDPRPPPIVVRFVRQTLRDEIIRLRKEYGSDSQS